MDSLKLKLTWLSLNWKIGYFDSCTDTRWMFFVVNAVDGSAEANTVDARVAAVAGRDGDMCR